MDQISDSTYPSPRFNYSISNTLFTVGLILFTCVPINYAIIGSAEQAMILAAYSFFFFLGSGLFALCCVDS